MPFIDTLVSILTPELLATTLRISTPIILAALGGTICEKAGVINIGLEGMMLAGAFAAVYISHIFQNAVIGAFGGVICGGLIGLVLAFGAITLRANQIVLGAAINIFVGGLTGFLTTVIFSPGASARVPGLQPMTVPILRNIPWIGTVLFSHSATVYLAVSLAILGHFLFSHTPFGAWIRAAGDRPLALHSAGKNVKGIRFLAVFLSGCLAGLGGVHLSLSTTRHFTVNMSGGRGFLGLAANIFGKWTPLGSLWASLFFGFSESLKFKSAVLKISPELLIILPFVLTLIVLVSVVGRAEAPQALGEVYDIEHE